MADSYSNLRKFVCPEIVFGSGARSLAGNYAHNMGMSNPLVVSDPGIEKTGWLKDVVTGVERSGLRHQVFTDISPNPRASEVAKGVETFSAASCDGIIAVGGGSAMDCAKGIGIVAANGGSILSFEGVDNIPNPVVPLIFVPTTSGSSADVSQFAIITDSNERVKIAIVSKKIVPDLALIDPDTTSTMSSHLAACTGIDALVHATEAFVSTGASPLSDIHALEAIRLLRGHLTDFVKDRHNTKAREIVMRASMEAGLAFSNAILGAVHAMSHSLGGYLDLAHGECNAILLEHVVDFNFPSAAERYGEIASAMGMDTRGMDNNTVKGKLVEEIVAFKASVGITNTLGEVGVSPPDIPTLAKKAVKDACILTNPRPANERDVEVIYEQAR